MSISAKYFQFLHFSESFQLKCCVCITSPSTNSCAPPPPHKFITSLIVIVLHTIHACTNIHAQINSYIVAHMWTWIGLITLDWIIYRRFGPGEDWHLITQQPLIPWLFFWNGTLWDFSHPCRHVSWYRHRRGLVWKLYWLTPRYKWHHCTLGDILAC